MTTNSVGFVGGGRIARILLAGWAHAGCLPREVVVSDPDASLLGQLKRRFESIAVAPGDNTAAGLQQVVFVAVHPPLVVEVLRGIAGVLRENAIVVSLAPRITTNTIAESLNGFRGVARSIPNAPSVIGAGYNPIAFGRQFGELQRSEIVALFEPLGSCPIVDECTLEAYALLTAMGPTYFWPQFLELLELAKEFGLSDAAARSGLRAMVTGAAATLVDSGLDDESLLDLIPVKPLDEEQPRLREAYRRRLVEIHNKLKPETGS